MEKQVNKNQMDDLFDQFFPGTREFIETPAYKLVRRDDPSTSHEAAEQVDATRMERIVLDTIRTFGTDGCISDDVLALLHGYRYSTVTARYKQLKEKGLVIVDDRKRKAESGRQQLIMWAAEFYIEA